MNLTAAGASPLLRKKNTGRGLFPEPDARADGTSIAIPRQIAARLLTSYSSVKSSLSDSGELRRQQPAVRLNHLAHQFLELSPRLPFQLLPGL